MPITRTAWIDDDGSGEVGTVINNAEKTILYDQIDAFVGTGHITLVPAGTVNNWNPPGAAGVRFWTLAPTAPCTITGILAATDGVEHILSNESVQAITIAHGSASSTAGNLFLTPGAVSIVLHVYDTITIRYSSSLAFWQVLGRFS